MRKARWFVLVGIFCLGLSVYAGPGPGPVPPQAQEAPAIVLLSADQAAPDQVRALSAQNQEGRPLQAVGFERALDEPMLVDFTASRLPESLPVDYQRGTLDRGPDGSLVWTVLFAVPDAMALRLHLKSVALPEGSGLSVSRRGGQDRAPFGIETMTPEGALWSPFIHSSAISLRVEFPASIVPSGSVEVAGILEILKPKQEPMQAVAGPPCPAPGLTATEESAQQPLAIPAPPSNLSATSTSLNTILLQWVRNSTNEKGFKIQRQNGTTGKFKKVGTAGIGVVSYTDATVTPGLTYSYRVKAYNGGGASGPSNVATVIAGQPGNFSMRATPGCTGTNPQNVLDWTASTSASSYDVYRNGALLAPGITLLLYADPAVTAGQNYTYYAVARNTYGSFNSNTVSATALTNCCPLPGTTTLSASPGCAGGVPLVSLSWTAATGATSYDVYRNGVSYVTGQTATTYTDHGVTAGQNYNYQVVSKNVCGTTQSNTAPATAPATCCPNPGAFTLTITPFCFGGSGYTLQWSAASGVSSTFSYDIYRDGVLAYSGIDQSVVHFDPALAGSTHHYFIRAYNTCGTTDSNTASDMAPTNCTTYVDDLQTSLFIKSGPPAFWWDISNVNCWDGHMWYTTNTAGGPGTSINYAYWHVDLSPTGPGNYTIFVYIPCLVYADTTHADYYVYHGGSFVGPITVNQNNYCNEWVSLGTYYCYADGLDSVALGDATLEPAGSRDVGFDAIAWVK